MADWTRRNEVTERNRPSTAAPPAATGIVPVAPASAPATATPSAFPADAAAPAAPGTPNDALPPSGTLFSALSLSLGIGAAGSAVALLAQALTPRIAGPLPYEPAGTGYTVVVSLLGALAAVFLTRWAGPSAASSASPGDRFRHVPAAALPIAAMAVWLGFTIQGARDDARDYDAAERGAPALPVLEQRASQRPAHAMTEFALGAAYLREHRYPDAIAALGYARELDPRNERAAQLRKQAVNAMIAESHPEMNGPDPHWPKESIETTIRIGRYYTSLLAAGDHSPSVYEGILAGLRLEKRYDQAISIAEMYLAEHPGDQLWTARLAELRRAPRP